MTANGHDPKRISKSQAGHRHTCHTVGNRCSAPTRVEEIGPSFYLCAIGDKGVASVRGT